MRCSKGAGNGWQCRGEAIEGHSRCAKCKASQDSSRKAAKDRATAAKADFMARHATRTPPPIQPTDDGPAPAVEIGRRYGATEVLLSIDAKWVRALCHFCGNGYDCDRRRIQAGTAARHGCGCKGGASRRVCPPCPAPHAPVIPYSRKGTSL